MITNNDIDAITDADLQSLDGDKIGGIQQVYLDDATNSPAWVTVRTGLFGNKVSFVPLASASWDGDALRVPYEKDFVKDAPKVDPDTHLSAAEEVELYRYYGLEYGTHGAGYTGDLAATDTAPAVADATADADATTTAPVAWADASETAAAPVAYTDTDTDTSTDTSTEDDADITADVAASTGDSMTRSEEQLSVGTEQREAGRARLRKYVVTEQQTVTVPVSHEEVRLEREPITEGAAGDAYDGAEIAEAEHEVVLHEEVPVVTTEVRPVERVRLATETVTGTEEVTGEVRKEQIELENDDSRA